MFVTGMGEMQRCWLKDAVLVIRSINSCLLFLLFLLTINKCLLFLLTINKCLLGMGEMQRCWLKDTVLVIRSINSGI